MERSIARYRGLPERMRLGLAALIGVALGWVTYELVHLLNPLRAYRATTSWGAAWFVSVWRQHALHHWLTFSSSLPYGRGLRRAYLLAAVSGGLGVVVNLQLTGPLGVHHRVAWLIGVGLSGLVSLAFLKRFVYPEG